MREFEFDCNDELDFLFREQGIRRFNYCWLPMDFRQEKVPRLVVVADHPNMVVEPPIILTPLQKKLPLIVRSTIKGSQSIDLSQKISKTGESTRVDARNTSLNSNDSGHEIALRKKLNFSKFKLQKVFGKFLEK